jgi:hypothetical protein
MRTKPPAALIYRRRWPIARWQGEGIQLEKSGKSFLIGPGCFGSATEFVVEVDAYGAGEIHVTI